MWRPVQWDLQFTARARDEEGERVRWIFGPYPSRNAARLKREQLRRMAPYRRRVRIDLVPYRGRDA